MRKMISLRLTSLILAAFLLLHALRNSLAHAHQATVANTLSRKIHLFARKEFVDANNNHVSKAKMVAMGGRKMMINHGDDHMVTENPTPMLSGAPKVNDTSDFEVKGDLEMRYKVNDHTTASGYSSMKLNEDFSATDYHGNHQEGSSLKITSSVRSYEGSDIRVEEKAFRNLESLKPTPLYNSNKVKTSHDYESRASKDEESKRILEAAKEIMKLMHKDYGGRGKPKRRPPINNHNPKH